MVASSGLTLLVPVVVAASVLGASAVRTEVSFSENYNASKNYNGLELGSPSHEEAKAICSQVKQCYCIRKTLYKMNDMCGWCESTQSPMLGGVSGPLEGECGMWIFRHEKCPYLYCEDDLTTGFYVCLVAPPAFFALAWCLAMTRWRSQARPPQKPSELLCVARTRGEFAKGLHGERAMMSSKPFQAYFPYAPSLHLLLLRISQGSVVELVLVGAMRFGFIMSVFFTVLRLTPLVMTDPNFKVFSSTLEEVRDLSSTLKVSVGFLFSFYALGRISWWWGVIDCCRSMQGRSHDLALLIGGYSAVKAVPAGKSAGGGQATWLEAKWHFYRFLLVDWILCFRGLSPDFATVTMDDLHDAGFMEGKEEHQIIEKSTHPRDITIKWMATWIEHHVQDDHLRQLAMDKLCALRGAEASLHDTVELRAPMSFEGLMYTLVIAWVSLLPFGRLMEVGSRKIVLEQNVFIPTMSAVCTYAFYMAMVAMLECFKEPFGNSKDGLNTETLLLETETTVWDYLTSPAPVCLEHTLTAERFALPPAEQGKRSSAFKMEVPGIAAPS